MLPGVSGVLITPLGGDLSWREFDIPGGNQPVRLVRLRIDEVTRAATLAVLFPDGWARDETGSYDSSEEFVVLGGRLRMNEEVYEAGDWAYVPSRTARYGTIAGPASLTLARFDGPARWRAGSGVAREVSRRKLGAPGNSGGTVLGRDAVVLRDGDDSASWIIDAPEGGSEAPSDLELLELETLVWAWVPAGSPIPALEGRCFCRTFAVSGGDE